MAMRTTSLRGKITAGYVLSLLFLLIFASVLFVNLLVAEERIAWQSGISRFLDTTLEMRRYEKNYFLYGQREDLDAAIRYAAAASALISGGAAAAGAPWVPRWLAFLADPGREARRVEPGPERTSRLLDQYRTLLERTALLSGKDAAASAAIGTEIRDLGRTITGIAEQLSSAEARNIQQVLRSGRRTLILLVVLFLLGTGIVARIVLLTAIRPLKGLESGMQRIASGDLQLLPEGTGKGEIATMNAAFNRMIREVFQHREERMQSERLASLGTMLAGIAHELNNPLSNISTSAELLAEEGEELGAQERRELVAQIVSQTDRATDIIRTVLDFSREPRAVEHRSTNLLSAALGSVVLVRGELPAHVSVEVDVAPEIEVLGDKTRLQQAFINLMTNSIDAMREIDRDGRIAISARPSGERDVDIAFRDNGAGIPRHLLDRVFDPFFSTKDVGRGTGLGLYVTHQIVEQHGGTIRVESEVGKGTTVTIRLPRAAGEPAGAGAAQEGS